MATEGKGVPRLVLSVQVSLEPRILVGTPIGTHLQFLAATMAPDEQLEVLELVGTWARQAHSEVLGRLRALAAQHRQ